jgi:HEAT repeat protein
MIVARSLLLVLLAAGVARGQEISNKDLGRKALETTLSYIKSQDPDVRSMAADILGATGNKAAAGVLKKMLADTDKNTRINAAEALWNLGDPSGLKVVYSVIGDVPAQGPVGNSPLVELKIISQNKIREHAIEALARMKGEKAADMLFNLKNDNYGSIRDVAARELARLGYSDELAQFLDALASEDEAMRFEGANILGKICNSDAVEPLKGLLAAEQSMRVRIAALDAIKCMSDKKRALPELLKLADDGNPTLKFKAVSALSSIPDAKAFAKIKEISGATNDISLKIAAFRGLIAGGEKPAVEVLTRAFDSNSQDVKIEALNALQTVPDSDAKPYLLTALNDNSVNVRLGAALQVLKRFTKKK